MTKFSIEHFNTIRDIVQTNRYNYRRLIKEQYPKIFKYISSQPYPFPKATFLFYTNSKEEDHFCSICNKPTNFRKAWFGYSRVCSLTCNNKILNSVSRIECNTLPKKEIILVEIGTKYNSIPALLMRKYPQLHKYLNEKFSSGSISEKLYLWISSIQNPKCISCNKNTRFLDFRRGYQTYCSNKCMANCSITRRKKEETLISKTGFSYPMQNAASKSKQKISAFSTKDYTLPSGKIVKIQGFEGWALDQLFESGIQEEQIIVDECKIPQFFWFDAHNKSHRYYPDFYIPHLNLIIEVKSTYTLLNGYESNRNDTGLTELEINLLKRQSVIDAGFEFKFMIR